MVMGVVMAVGMLLSQFAADDRHPPYPAGFEAGGCAGRHVRRGWPEGGVLRQSHDDNSQTRTPDPAVCFAQGLGNLGILGRKGWIIQAPCP
jgi:hypothetical protein